MFPNERIDSIAVQSGIDWITFNGGCDGSLADGGIAVVAVGVVFGSF